MKISAFLAHLTLATALPHLRRESASPTADNTTSADLSTTQFYLVTTSSSQRAQNASLLPAVSATSLFAPLHQSNLLLRSISPGYNSLPQFTFADGALHTLSPDGFGQGSYTYTTPKPTDGAELQFLKDGTGSGFELIDGFLLAVDGGTDRWSLCDGALGEKVIKYQASEAGCTAIYVQAVASPPY